MAVFKPNAPIKTYTPTISVDNHLKPGKYRFRLIVTDADGHRSRPVYRVVIVLDPTLQIPRPRKP